MKNLVVLTITNLLISCQGQTNRHLENYGDISASPGGIALSTPEEHVGGWGRRDCLLCHNIELNVHRRPGSVANADAIIDLTKKNGVVYCLVCHGPNGVQ